MQAPKSSKAKHEQDRQSWLQNLDKLRRSSGLKIDHKGDWWHREDRFEHPRIIATLNSGLAWEDQSQSNEQAPAASKTVESEQDEQLKHQILNDKGSDLLQSVFGQWIGEATVQVGQQWCYIDCDYTPFLVSKLKTKLNQDGLYVVLNTGLELELGPLGLKDDILYSRLSQSCLARFTVHAQLQVMEWLTEGEQDSSGKSHLKLVYKNREWTILSP